MAVAVSLTELMVVVPLLVAEAIMVACATVATSVEVMAFALLRIDAAALASLAELAAPDVQRQATGLLADPVFYVRTQAVRILSGFRNAEAVRALTGALADGHDAVQLAAQKALVSIEDAGLDVPAGEGARHA